MTIIEWHNLPLYSSLGLLLDRAIGMSIRAIKREWPNKFPNATLIAEDFKIVPADDPNRNEHAWVIFCEINGKEIAARPGIKQSNLKKDLGEKRFNLLINNRVYFDTLILNEVQRRLKHDH
jgi:hypothetical protein